MYSGLSMYSSLTISCHRMTVWRARLHPPPPSGSYKYGVTTHVPADARRVFFSSKNATFLEKLCIFVILQVWSDYPRARRGFIVLKNSTFLRKCVRFVSFKNILVSCLNTEDYEDSQMSRPQSHHAQGLNNT